jgi:hypothetical protein
MTSGTIIRLADKSNPPRNADDLRELAKKFENGEVRNILVVYEDSDAYEYLSWGTISQFPVLSSLLHYKVLKMIEGEE